VNAASREALLRVPGFGVRAVDRILKIRRYHRLTSADLLKLHIPMSRSQHFIVTNDVRAPKLDAAGLADRVVKPEQMGLFEAQQLAAVGEF
jgi:predicted DNA-binding helix-hairpin-helix protein